MIDRVEGLGQVNEDGCTLLSVIDGGYDIVQDLERGLGAPMTSLETRLHSGEGTMQVLSNLRGS
jgi:hypothetical protein